MRRRLTYRPSRSEPLPPVSDEPALMSVEAIAGFLSMSGKPRMAEFVRRMQRDATRRDENVRELVEKLRAHEPPPPPEPYRPHRRNE